MNIRLSLIVSIAAMLLIPGWAFANQIEGTIQGFTCVTSEKVCPVGKEDPVVAVERVFVVFLTGGKYYFVPNLDRAVMARHIREKVRVTGDLNEKYNAITAKTFEVWKDEKWHTSWSSELQKDWITQIHSGDMN